MRTKTFVIALSAAFAVQQAAIGRAQEEDEAPRSDESEDSDYWSTLRITPGLQAFAEYDFDLLPDGDSYDYFHRFDVPRVFVYSDWALGDLRARILVEGTRSAEEGALIGVAGDSILLRFREAWMGYRAFDLFELRAGIVPTLTAPAMTEFWGMRPIAQTAVRRFDLMHAADVGATLTVDIPERFGRIGVGFYNGEGYHNPEFNRGKNTEFFAEVHPLAFAEDLRPLTLIAALQLGSSGPASARADRLLLSLGWNGERIGGGIGGSYLMGIDGRSGQQGLLLEAWIRANPVEGLLLAARSQRYVVDLNTDGQALTELTVSVGYRILNAVGAHLAFDGRFAEAPIASSLAGYERFRIRLVVEGSFEHTFTAQIP